MTIIQPPESFKPLSVEQITALFTTHGKPRCIDAVVKIIGRPANSISRDLTPEQQYAWLRELEPELPLVDPTDVTVAAEPHLEPAPGKSELHLAALAYAAKGWPVFPCLEGLKVPATANGLKDATTDPAQIDAWWTENKNYNVAFEPECAGLAVIDADTYHEGCNIEALHLPETHEVTTPRGGTHYYFLGSVPTTVGDEKKPDKALGPHIDTRGRGSYALLPPSSIPEFGDYIVKAERPFAKLPDEITAKLAKRDEPAKAPSDVQLDLPGNIARARAFLENQVKRGRVSKIGERGHDTCYEVACGLVRDLGISTSLAIELMLDLWYPHCTPNDDPNFVRERVLSAGRNGQNAPGAFAAPAPDVAFAGANLPVLPEPSTPPDNIMAGQWNRMLEKYRLRDPVEEANRPPLTFYDKERLWPHSPEGAVGFVYGDTGTHKTGFALSKAIDLVFNHPTKPRVAFFAGEGAYAFGQSRVPAICKHYGKTVEELRDTGRFSQISAVPLLNSADEMLAVKHQLDKFRPDIIIIETFSRAILGRYNAPDFVGQAYDVLDAMRREYHALISVSHHEGKDASRGPMGSSQVTTHSDFVHYLEKVTPNTIQVHVEKMRDGEDDFDVGFEVLRYNGVPVLVPVTEEELEQAKRATVTAIDPENFAFRDRVVKFLRDHGYNDHIHKSIETKDLAESLIAWPGKTGDAAANRKAEYEWEINVNKMITRLKNAAARGKGKRKSGMLSDLAEKHCRPGGSREFYFWAVRETGSERSPDQETE